MVLALDLIMKVPTLMTMKTKPITCSLIISVPKKKKPYSLTPNLQARKKRLRYHFHKYIYLLTQYQYVICFSIF